jgi:uncharacterized membrane protein
MGSRSGATLLWVLSVAFVVVGLAYMLAPSTFAELATGESPRLPSAVTDMRAVSGGVALGLGLFLGLCASRDEWVVPGLMLSALVLACMPVSRIIGFIVDGGVTGTQVSLAVFEAVALVLCVLALRARPAGRA